MGHEYNREYYAQYEPLFGVWHITKQIGEGSFGRVFELEREDFGQTYKAALKAITVPASEGELQEVLSEGMSEQSVRDYFGGFVGDLVKEFALMSRLKGTSNVVSYENHQVIEHRDGVGWDILIQMELLTPLNDYMRSHPVTRQDAIKLGIHMCKALELCQRYNIIHRDLKPENIFVSENGDFKLGDFGIARTVEKTTGGLSKKGTYNYMAPEVYKGEPYGSTVDIYSLGIVLYRLLNENRLPFLPAYPTPITHMDRENALMQRMGGTPLPMPVHGEGRLGEIVLKACAYRSGDRYSSPAQMRQELESIVYDRGEAPYIYPEGDGLPQRSVKEVGTGEEMPVLEKGLQEELEKTVSVFGQETGGAKENQPGQSDAETRPEQTDAETRPGQDNAKLQLERSKGETQPGQTESDLASDRGASRHGPKKGIIELGIGVVAVILILVIGMVAFRDRNRNTIPDVAMGNQADAGPGDGQKNQNGNSDRNPTGEQDGSGGEQEDAAQVEGSARIDTYWIGICQQGSHEVLDAATEGFQDALVQKLGDRVAFEVLNAEGDRDFCAHIAEQFVAEDVDLILANGAASLQAAADATSRIPILGTSVTDYPAALGMEEWAGLTGRNVSGTCDLIPPSEVVDMLCELFPSVATGKVSTIIISVSPTWYPDLAYQVDAVKRELEKRRLPYEECIITDYDIFEIEDLAGAYEAGTYGIPVYVPSRFLKEVSGKAVFFLGEEELGKFPLMTGDASMVEVGCDLYSDGVAAVLSASYYDMGYQAGLMAYEILENGADISAMEVQYASRITKTYIEDNRLVPESVVPDDYERISWDDWTAALE